MAQTALALEPHASVAERLWGIVLGGTSATRRRWRFSLPCRGPVAAAPLREAVDRAGGVIPSRRIVAVVERGHQHSGRDLADVQRVVQPAYRGTAAEVFLPSYMIAQRDPSAIVVVLPVEGVGQHEASFLPSMRRAAETVAERPDLLLVMGMAPPCARPPGWIEPGEPITGLESLGVRAVRRFLRRPSFAQAVRLGASGGLVNTGVVVAHVETLLALGRRRVPDVLETLEPLRTAFGGPEEHLLCEAIYEGMPYADIAHALYSADEPFGVFPIPRTRARVRPVASA
jgi:mannose-1-phosphate guanylyltransferase